MHEPSLGPPSPSPSSPTEDVAHRMFEGTLPFASRLVLLAAASIVVGAAFRFAWPGDMEFKADERYMFERSQFVGVSEPWPAVGMETPHWVPLVPGTSMIRLPCVSA